ncbi:flavin reductase [Rhizobium sp. GN54]|uniref:flavin reductase n=1 Tax=Rhizobium sp. GN54 TaxID=2898150 RepID=UPI001E44C27E|nr:flavin reductase [Rhizobium sp. GN54]MCD2182885.1 flavin reductase [Rhizobium sp. GN54]
MSYSFDTIETADFRNGMSRLGAAVNIVTTRSAEGPFGFTASAVCSVSDTPPTLLACINRKSSCFPAFEDARFFCVNTLAPGHEALSNLFGGKTAMAERFSAGRWIDGRTGAPVLADALVSFECELSHAFDEGTHRVLFGRVIDIRATDSDAALFYCARRYVAINGAG